jgi:hypothetical protein
MFGWLSSIFQKQVSLERHLQAKRLVTIKGVQFVIQRVRLLDYLSGAKVMAQTFDIYKAALEQGNKELPTSWKKVEEHVSDVILAGVVSPRISRVKDDDTIILVQDLFNDWEMAAALYEQIMTFTNGDKKKHMSPLG